MRRLELRLLPCAQRGPAIARGQGRRAARLAEQQHRGAAHLGYIGLQAGCLGLQAGHVGLRAGGRAEQGDGGAAAHVLDVEDAVAVGVAIEGVAAHDAAAARALLLGEHAPVRGGGGGGGSAAASAERSNRSVCCRPRRRLAEASTT